MVRRLPLEVLVTVALLLWQAHWINPVFTQPIEVPRFTKIILISYDGVSRRSIVESVQFGDSPNMAFLLQRGAITDLRMVDHKTSTDPGLAVIETGYGPTITRIDSNYFGAGSEKRSIPDGLTITERIKASYGESWKTALVMPWTQRRNNVSANEDSTFWNALKKTDFVFSAEDLIWSRSDPVIQKNTLGGVPTAEGGGGVLLRANFTATVAAKFIEQNFRSNFYLRTHWIEPDTIGHGANDHYPDGTMTLEYRKALRDVDEGLGIILNTLRLKGILDETLVLVTTDHGFAGGHGGEGWPFEDPLISVTWTASSHPAVRSPIGWGIMNDIAPTILAAAAIDVSTLTPRYSETSGGMPLWLVTEKTRDLMPPKILRVSSSASSLKPTDTFTVILAAEDESGLSQVRLFYLPEGINYWRFAGFNKVGDEYRATLSNFLPGRAVQWYVVVVDNSPAKNWARYPIENSLVVSVSAEGSPSGGTSQPALEIPVLGYIGVGLGIVLGVAFLAIKTRFNSPKQSKSV